MLSDEEKSHILERVQYEGEIRKSLENVPDFKPESPLLYWLNSKLGILLLGALMTGILIPWFQYTQKTIEWKRQNQFANISFRLEMMRSGLKELVYLTAFPAEAYEMVKPFLLMGNPRLKSHDDFAVQYFDLKNRRFSQNAKVKSFLIYFGETEELTEGFDGYINLSGEYLSAIERLVHMEYCRTHKKDCSEQPYDSDKRNKLQFKIKRSFTSNHNEKYLGVVDEMKRQIKEAENASEQYRL